MLRTMRALMLGTVFACGSAQAVIVNMGTDPVDQSVVNSFTAGTPSFIDTVFFSLTEPSGLVTTAFSNWSVPTAGLRNLTLQLFQGNTLLATEGPSTVVVPGNGIPAFTLESLTETLAAGSYRLVLSGTVRPDGGFYAWTVSTSAIAPVPEPAGWAMLVAGLALVGAAAQRRSGRKFAVPV